MHNSKSTQPETGKVLCTLGILRRYALNECVRSQWAWNKSVIYFPVRRIHNCRQCNMLRYALRHAIYGINKQRTAYFACLFEFTISYRKIQKRSPHSRTTKQHHSHTWLSIFVGSIMTADVVCYWFIPCATFDSVWNVFHSHEYRILFYFVNVNVTCGRWLLFSV